MQSSNLIDEFADVVINEEAGAIRGRKLNINNMKKKNKTPAITGPPCIADLLQ